MTTSSLTQNRLKRWLRQHCANLIGYAEKGSTSGSGRGSDVFVHQTFAIGRGELTITGGRAIATSLRGLGHLSVGVGDNLAGNFSETLLVLTENLIDFIEHITDLAENLTDLTVNISEQITDLTETFTDRAETSQKAFRNN